MYDTDGAEVRGLSRHARCLRVLGVSNKNTFYHSSSHSGVWHSPFYIEAQLRRSFPQMPFREMAVDGKPFELWNRKGRINSSYEKAKGGISKARRRGLIRSQEKLLLLWK